ncbi:hypothetical protein LJC49_07135 [Ruminococcaceae bacterium OttesenSCG-928-I18]|nr:hypothetical protein [Ruminococcaceae bacterium OttesenSCG-928-I18]
MKLSELKQTDEFCDVLLTAAPYVWNFIDDEAIIAFWNSRQDKIKDGMAAGRVSKRLAFEIATAAIGSRREDTYGILAALNGTGVDDIKHQPPGKTIFQVVELVMDLISDNGLFKDIMRFFSQSEPLDTSGASGT